MATISFVGNLGRDPEQKGNGPVKFSVADNDSRGEDASPWYDVDVWGKQGENCAKYLHKGSKVFVSGELELHKYNDKLYPRVRADRVRFMDPKAEGESAPKSAPSAEPKQDDHIPF